jgi:mycoredoxin
MKNHIDFLYIDIEKADDAVVQKVIDANGGKDWVVPTMEFEGKWRKGKKYSDKELDVDLKEMGVITS